MSPEAATYAPELKVSAAPRAGEVFRGRPGKLDDKTRVFRVQYVAGSFVMVHVLGPDADELPKPRAVANVDDFAKFRKIG